MKSLLHRTLSLVLVAAFLASGCATFDTPPPAAPPAALDAATEARILALDPAKITAADVRDTLSRAPAPRIVLMHGGVYPVHLLMESFGRFLIGMGYPEARIRDPGSGDFSYTPYGDSAQQAGMIAWFYESEAVRPIVIGHSQGGIQAVKVLHELAGAFKPEIRVYNPVANRTEGRTTITDPLTGKERPVVGLSVASASVIGTGGWALVLPVHWNVAPVIRTIPDTVDEFTGYRIGVDMFAWDVPGLEGLKTFHSAGRASVRNVTLPAAYSHVFVPATERILADAARREWVENYAPTGEDTIAEPQGLEGDNIAWAADVWHGVKKHWALEAQRLIRARREGTAARGVAN